MPTGSSHRTSTRTTSLLLYSPRSKGDFYSPRYSRVPVRSRLPSIPFSPLLSANEPKPGQISAVRAVVSRLPLRSTVPFPHLPVDELNVRQSVRCCIDQLSTQGVQDSEEVV